MESEKLKLCIDYKNKIKGDFFYVYPCSDSLDTKQKWVLQVLDKKELVRSGNGFV